MKLSSKYLLSPLFIGALIVLMCNDIWWKYTFSNGLTGKLSDFSGVLVLGLLFNFFSEKNRMLNALFVIVFFTFWKSPLSEGLIFAWNDLHIFPIARVVDYSDLIAFSILPIVTHFPFKERPGLSRSLLTSSLLGITFFALTATSRTHDSWGYNAHRTVINFDSKLSQEILINQFSSKLNLTLYKQDTVWVDYIPVARFCFSSNPSESPRHIVDSCELTLQEKNPRKINVNILSLKLKKSVDIANATNLKYWALEFDVRKVKQQTVIYSDKPL